MPHSLELDPHEASERIKKAGSVLIDVREPAEFGIAKVPGSRLIPMQSIPAELQTLEGLADDGDLFFLCHHGVRSLQVVSWLRDHGVENCYSIRGGIERWSAEIDTSIPRY
jgi:rhodanese-related sulfurtransferase